MRTRTIILVGIVVNAILCFLPIYDSINFASWLSLSLSFHNSAPVFYGNLNPESIFTLIFLVPIGLVYKATLSIYASAVTLKLILFGFFFLLILVVDKILKFYNIENSTRNFLLALLFLNPGILFVNYVWDEIEIIPAFFATLGYYLLRVRPLNSENLNLIFSITSLFISVFFFLYSVILIPSLILFTRSQRDRLKIFLLSLVTGTAFLLVQVFLIQGYLYNYAASLTGSNPVLAPSSLPTGLFYYFHFSGNVKLIMEIVLVLFVSIVLPLILYLLKYSEQSVLYIILAIFLFISITINMDNFMFIVPFVFLAAVNNNGKALSRSKILWISSLLYIPLVFAPLVYGPENVYGIFYWLWPLLHISVTRPSSSIIANIISAYNFFFMLFLYLTVTLVLLDGRGASEAPEFSTKLIEGKGKLNTNRLKVNRKIIALILAAILLSVPLSLIYNDYNGNVSIQNPENFPLLYFHPEFGQNSAIALPLGNGTYSFTGSLLTIPKSTQLLLERNISNQYFSMNYSIIISHMLMGGIGYSIISSTNTWALFLNEVFNSGELSILNPSYSNATSSANAYIPFLTENTLVYNFTGKNELKYEISSSFAEGKTFLLFYKPTYILASQSDALQIYFNNNILEIAMYPSYAVVAEWNGLRWAQTGNIPYSSNLNGWNEAELTVGTNSLQLGFNGVFYRMNSIDLAGNISIVAGTPYRPYPYYGYSSGIFYYNEGTFPYTNEILLASENNTYHVMRIIDAGVLGIDFTNSPDSSSIILNGKQFTVKPSKYIYFGKEGGSYECMIKINKLFIKYRNSNGYYMVPAFIAFYVPTISAFLFVLTTFLPFNIRRFY
ncbi:MAG: hypothetical protein QW292_07700 [Candidatus Parvarchaeota archaeon]